MMTLDKVKNNILVSIKDIDSDLGSVGQRLLELGFEPGQRVKIVARSALKKACLLQIRGYLLSVRTSLLKGVIVQ